MKTMFLLLGWILGIFFLILFVLSLWSKHWLASLLPLIMAVLVIPPTREWLNSVTGIPFPFWARMVLVPVLFVVFFYVLMVGSVNKFSIYKTPEIKSQLMAIYDARLKQWPVPFEQRFIQTEYGKVHVIISGPENASPMLLLHASAMGSWSWLYTIAGINEKYRTYAIDTIGDAGKSVLDDINRFPNSGAELVALYSEIMDSLGVKKASFVGASQGGFIATNMALLAPERVEKLLLSGPMGYTGTNSSVLRIFLTSLFPVKPLQDDATRWAFGDNPKVLREVEDWFQLILSGVISRQARPKPFSMEALQQLKAPALLFLGTKDGLVGNPENGKRLVKNIPNFRVEVLEAGHLISADQPERFNELVLGFVSEE